MKRTLIAALGCCILAAPAFAFAPPASPGTSTLNLLCMTAPSTHICTDCINACSELNLQEKTYSDRVSFSDNKCTDEHVKEYDVLQTKRGEYRARCGSALSCDVKVTQECTFSGLTVKGSVTAPISASFSGGGSGFNAPPSPPPSGEAPGVPVRTPTIY